MKKVANTITFGLSVLLLACSAPPAATTTLPSAATAGLPWRAVADAAVTGGTSRYDYQSLDSSSGRLYIAHLGADLMTVFDVNKQTVIGDVKDLKRVHGVLAVPEL